MTLFHNKKTRGLSAQTCPSDPCTGVIDTANFSAGPGQVYVVSRIEENSSVWQHPESRSGSAVWCVQRCQKSTNQLASARTLPAAPGFRTLWWGAAEWCSWRLGSPGLAPWCLPWRRVPGPLGHHGRHSRVGFLRTPAATGIFLLLRKIVHRFTLRSGVLRYETAQLPPGISQYAIRQESFGVPRQGKGHPVGKL